MSDEPLSTCPECGSERFKRKVPKSVSVAFVGAGFYVNDSGSKKE